MPKRELKHPRQVEAWLQEWGTLLAEPGSLILIGSGGLLWHAAQLGIKEPLPENSMDVDPVTQSDAVALLGYEAMIGSEFEKTHGWEKRASRKVYGRLDVVVPSVDDLLFPKLKQGEPRDKVHAPWAEKLK